MTRLFRSRSFSRSRTNLVEKSEVPEMPPMKAPWEIDISTGKSVSALKKEQAVKAEAGEAAEPPKTPAEAPKQLWQALPMAAPPVPEISRADPPAAVPLEEEKPVPEPESPTLPIQQPPTAEEEEAARSAMADHTTEVTVKMEVAENQEAASKTEQSANSEDTVLTEEPLKMEVLVKMEVPAAAEVPIAAETSVKAEVAPIAAKPLEEQAVDPTATQATTAIIDLPAKSPRGPKSPTLSVKSFKLRTFRAMSGRFDPAIRPSTSSGAMSRPKTPKTPKTPLFQMSSKSPRREAPPPLPTRAFTISHPERPPVETRPMEVSVGQAVGSPRDITESKTWQTTLLSPGNTPDSVPAIRSPKLSDTASATPATTITTVTTVTTLSTQESIATAKPKISRWKSFFGGKPTKNNKTSQSLNDSVAEDEDDERPPEPPPKPLPMPPVDAEAKKAREAEARKSRAAMQTPRASSVRPSWKDSFSQRAKAPTVGVVQILIEPPTNSVSKMPKISAPAPAHTRQRSVSEPISPLPLLNVEIPQASMERYSIMFNTILNPVAKPSRRSNLFARRQSRLEMLGKSVKEPVIQTSPTTGDDPRPLRRAMSSPLPSADKNGKSPTVLLSLFPTPGPMTPRSPRNPLSSHPPRSLRNPLSSHPLRQPPRLQQPVRPQTAGAPPRQSTLKKAQSMSALKTRIPMKKRPSVRFEGITVTPPESPTIKDLNLTPPSPTRSSTASDTDTEPSPDDRKKVKPVYAIKPEPQWDMVAPLKPAAGVGGGGLEDAFPAPPTMMTVPVRIVDERESLDLVRVAVAREIPVQKARRELLKPLDFRNREVRDRERAEKMRVRMESERESVQGMMRERESRIPTRTVPKQGRRPTLVDLSGNRKSQRVTFVEG